MNNNLSHYQYQDISAENQPPILTPEQIPDGYRQRQSGLLVKSNIVGNMAARSAEQADQHKEIKEVLRNQKAEVLSGYNQLAEDLGEEPLREADFDKALAFNLNKWAADGSLSYLSVWLKRNEENKIYLAASPNRIIELDRILAAGEKIGNGNSSAYLAYWGDVEDFHNSLNRDFLKQYSNEELCGQPKRNNDGNILPVQLAVWTDDPNLEQKLLGEMREYIIELKKAVGSASDQTILQSLGYWYRLRENERFGGPGIVYDSRDDGSKATFAAQFTARSVLNEYGRPCIPIASIGCVNSAGASLSGIEIDIEDKELAIDCDRFIIS